MASASWAAVSSADKLASYWAICRPMRIGRELGMDGPSGVSGVGNQDLRVGG